MDSESVDLYLQEILSSLFPPYHLTAPAFLPQVSRVLQGRYHGDALNYLLNFLLPGKQLLEDLKQHACVQYEGLPLPPGWPLCLQEKVVVQLSPLDLKLQPGDFYFLLSPPPPSSPRHPRLLLVSAAPCRLHDEQQEEQQEVQVEHLLSMEWLDSVNRRRGAPPLQRLLLATGGDVFRLPWEDLVFPQYTSQSAASSQRKTGDIGQSAACSQGKTGDIGQSESEGEESEGEYVELKEEPFPRFSPQKGSLTQSISLQHRAHTLHNTPAHTLHNTPAHTLHNTPTHTLHNTPAHTLHNTPAHTPHNTPSAAASHTSFHTHKLTAAHTHQNTHIHSNAATHTLNNSQTLAAAHTLHYHTHTAEHPHKSTHTHFDAAAHTPQPPHTHTVAHTLQPSHTHTVAHTPLPSHTHTAAHTPLPSHTHTVVHTPQPSHTHTAAHTPQPSHTHTAAHTPQPSHTHTVAHTLQPSHTHTAAHTPQPSHTHTVAHTPQPSHTHSSHTDLCSRLLKEVFLTPPSSSSSFSVSSQKPIGGEDSHSENHSVQTLLQDSYSERDSVPTLTKNSYSERDSVQTLTKESYSEKDSVPTLTKDSYSERDSVPTLTKDSYSERDSVQKLLQHSYSERDSVQALPEDSYSEQDSVQTLPEDSYSERDSVPTLTKDSFSEKDSVHTLTKDSYSEKDSVHTLTKDSYSERDSVPTLTKDSYFERDSVPTLTKDCYSERDSVPTLPEDSYSEKDSVQKLPEDSYSERDSVQTLTKDSYSERDSVQTLLQDSYSERDSVQALPENSYSEQDSVQTLPEDSYSERDLVQTLTKQSYSERDSVQTLLQYSYSEQDSVQTLAEDSYSEKDSVQTLLQETYSERDSVQALPEDSYSERDSVQTLLQDSYSERDSVQTLPEDSYSEKDSVPTLPEDSYSEKDSVQTLPEDSHSEKDLVQALPEDSYSERDSVHTLPEDSYSERDSVPTLPEDSYSEKDSVPTLPEDSYSERDSVPTLPGDSYSERESVPTLPEDCYSERDSVPTLPEDSYSERDSVPTLPEDSYSERDSVPTLPEDCYSERDSVPTLPEEFNTPAMDCKREEPEDRQEVKEEEEEKDEEEELGGGRAAELQTEDLSPAGPCPTEPEPSAASVPVQTSQCSFYSELLRSAAVCLPGSRDRSGRALLTVCTLNPVWSLCDPKDLLRLLLYYTSTLRKQGSVLGLTVVVDARRAAPNPFLFSSLRSLKNKEPGSVHSVLLLVNKDSAVQLHTPADTQVLFSLKALQKQVALQQLPADLGGSFRFSHSSWLCFRSMLDQLSSQCADVIDLLQESINVLQMKPVPAEAEDAERMLSSFQEVMSAVLRDERVVRLQREGGASLSLLREKGSEEVMEVQALYEQVDELLHRLVSLNNLRSNQLASIRSFRRLEGGFSQVQAWLQDVAEPRLKTLSEAEDSLETLRKKQREFKEFHSTAYDWSRRGSSLLAQMECWVEERSCDKGSGDPWSADLQQCEVRVQRFWSELQDFSERVRTAGQNLERESRLSSFLDQAYGWALQGMRHLAGVRMEDCTLPDKCQAVIGCLEEYRLQHPPLPDTRFQEMREEAGHLRGGRGLQQWSYAWSKCQETKGVFDRKLEAALRSRSSDSAHNRSSESSHYSNESVPAHIRSSDFSHYSEASDSAHNRSSDSSHNINESDSTHKQLSGPAHNRSSDSSHYINESCPAHIRSSDSSHYSNESDSAHNMISDSAHNQKSGSIHKRSSAPFRRTLSALWGVQEKIEDSVSSPSLSSSSSSSLRVSSSLRNSSSSSLRNTSSTPLPPQHIPLLQRLFRSSSSEDPAIPSSSSSSSSSSFFSRRQHLRKTQSFDCPPSTPEGKWPSPFPLPEGKWSGPVPPPEMNWSSPSPPPKDKWSGPSPPAEQRSGPVPRSVSDTVRRGNIGVFIKGLEVSSPEAADRTLSPRISALSWAGQRPHTPLSSSYSSGPAETRPRGSKLRHLVEEMVTTEREYVRSLLYTLHHYLPEMERSDLPQDLRGKRCLVFGNLSRIHDFHRDFFLKELEACWKHPLRVPHCFLRHQEQFGLYALYSKNKPKSDALLAAYGNSFFRRKQLLLGDKMDLSSYLLKPVQRMSKYALLLTDIMKEVGGAPGEELSAQEAELSALHDATNMVKFQLRHGNDLLAMDAIRDCDVNLKEQGQLIRQDGFTVCSGRRKCQRHIFLFEELVLFSKPKKVEGGLDVFIYKHSFKTADVGLTESSGDDGLSFEIWFRRRTRKNQTFVLQAASTEVKLAWTNAVARILWTQANRNKEMRLKEMVSMGVGNKPFLDIQPSDAAISDRAVHYIMKGRGARTRASIAVSVFDHSDPFKRGALTSDPPTSGPSSSGLLGPLNLHMYSQPPPEDSFIITSCIEEDETETSSQPSMTTESSGSTGSDSGCPPSSRQDDGPPQQPPPSSRQLSACRPPANSIDPSTVV